MVPLDRKRIKFCVQLFAKSIVVSVVQWLDLKAEKHFRCWITINQLLLVRYATLELDLLKILQALILFVSGASISRETIAFVKTCKLEGRQ